MSSKVIDDESICIIICYSLIVVPIVFVLCQIICSSFRETIVLVICSWLFIFPINWIIKETNIVYVIESTDDNDTKYTDKKYYRGYDLLLLPISKTDHSHFKFASEEMNYHGPKIIRRKLNTKQIKELYDDNEIFLDMRLDQYREIQKKVSELSIVAGLVFTTSVAILISRGENNSFVAIIPLVCSILAIIVGLIANTRSIPQYYDEKKNMVEWDYHEKIIVQYFNRIQMIEQNAIQSEIKMELKSMMICFIIIALLSELLLLIPFN